MSLNSKMTALANGVRELSGSTEALGIDAMTTKIGLANEEIESQTDIIAQLREVVDNLPEQGGDDSEWLLRENTSYTNNTATTVGYGTFCYHQLLESINLPNVTSAKIMAFAYCPKLTTVNMPKLSTTNNYAFRDCTSLTSIYLPEAKQLPYAFVQCTALVSVNLPKLTRTRGTFYKCTGLTSITLPTSCNYIDISSFDGCTNLTSVTITSPTVATLVNVNAFNNMPVSQGTGYIYVPADLVNSYKTATNWSTYASRITAIQEV